MVLHPFPFAAGLALALVTSSAQAAEGPPASPTAFIAHYAQTAGQAADAARGQALFTRTHGREWSCASCHGAMPTADGKHAATGKRIAPLAPAFNPERFTDAAKVEKWFTRNCGDVLGRACTAQEKADVIAWLAAIAR